MARITIEDCLDSENNRFALVRLASDRAKQLLSGALPVTDTKDNRPVVVALREIAAGKVRYVSNIEREALKAIAKPATGLSESVPEITPS